MATAGVIVKGVIHLPVEIFKAPQFFCCLTWVGIQWVRHSQEAFGRLQRRQLLLGSPASSPGKPHYHLLRWEKFAYWFKKCERAPAKSRSSQPFLIQHSRESFHCLKWCCQPQHKSSRNILLCEKLECQISFSHDSRNAAPELISSLDINLPIFHP